MRRNDVRHRAIQLPLAPVFKPRIHPRNRGHQNDVRFSGKSIVAVSTLVKLTVVPSMAMDQCFAPTAKRLNDAKCNS